MTPAATLERPHTATVQQWRDRAACRGIDITVFFPSHTGPGANDAAKAVCRGCPVVDDCLDYALDVEGSLHKSHRSGVWGGLDPRERYQRWRCDTHRCRHPHHRETA